MRRVRGKEGVGVVVRVEVELLQIVFAGSAAQGALKTEFGWLRGQTQLRPQSTTPPYPLPQCLIRVLQEMKALDFSAVSLFLIFICFPGLVSFINCPYVYLPA